MRTVLAVDVGNTNTKWGLYEGEVLAHHWSVATRRDATADEWADFLRSALRMTRHEGRVDSVAISSVVPPLHPALADACRAVTGCDPLFLSPAHTPNLLSAAEQPGQIGADRIAAMTGALHLYGPPLIVITLGTASTFSVVDERGQYMGGAIAPGLSVSLDALLRHTARLSPPTIDRPTRVIGANTAASLQSGAFFGLLGQVEGVVERIRAAYRLPFRVVATGGWSSLVAGETAAIDHIHPHLILEGLRVIAENHFPKLCNFDPILEKHVHA